MKRKSDKLRQYEILARCLNGEKFSVTDLAFYYGVEDITINRDLSELRKSGIPINSRKKIIDIETDKIDKDLLVHLISEYCTKKLNSDLFFNKVRVLINNSGIKASAYLALLSKSIKEKKEVEIRYKRLSNKKINNYLLKPLEIINNQFNWILFANHNGIEKSFFINRIKELKLTDRKFVLTRTKSDSKTETIKLRFEPEVEEEVIGKIWFDKFKLNKESNGYIILTTQQQITNSLAAWCISWWNKIEVLEPEGLKNHIAQMIEAFRERNF